MTMRSQQVISICLEYQLPHGQLMQFDDRQVIDHERLSLTSRNAVMQRDMADLIHKHSQLSAFCERLKQNNAALQSSYHAGLQEHPQEVGLAPPSSS